MERSAQRTSRSTLVPVVAALAVLYVAKDVLIPLCLASLVAFLLTPAVTHFERWRLGRIPSVILVIFIAFSMVAGLGWVVGNQLIDALNALPNYKENIRHKVDAFRGSSSGGL